MRLLSILLLVSTLAIANIQEDTVSSQDFSSIPSKYDDSFINTVHEYISLDARYNHTFLFKRQSFFKNPDVTDPEQLLTDEEFTFEDQLNFQYPSLSITLFELLFLEKSYLPQNWLDTYNYLSFENTLLNLMVYQYSNLYFEKSDGIVFENKYHAAFYGLYAWEEEIQTIQQEGFLRASSADTLTVTHQRQGVFLSKVLENMFTVIGIMTHSGDGANFTKEIDKLPISFFRLTLIPMITGDAYFTKINYSYTKNGAQEYVETSEGIGLGFGAGFYLFSFDLFRTNYLNASFLSSFYYALVEDVYELTSGDSKGTKFIDQSASIKAKSYLSITF